MVIAQRNDTSLEIVFTAAGDAAHARRILRMAADGRLRKIYTGVYTGNLDSPLSAIVLRNWPIIVGQLLPGGVVSFRSAMVARPEEGRLYVTRGKTRRTVELPGLIVHVIPGMGPIIEGEAKDAQLKSVYLASESRWLLENLTAAKGVAERVISREVLEAYLDNRLILRGEHGLNRLRDTCRTLANALDMKKEFARLDKIIGTLLGTHEHHKLHSRQALARVAGKPYDPTRLELFDALFSHLKTHVMPQILGRAAAGQTLENFAFFESYFSNYIEGTTFLVSEAEQIVFEGKVIHNRAADSHDVLGTFHAALQTPWRNSSARTEDDFLTNLKSINALVMQSRPDKNPGEWKDKSNQVGSTLFVEPLLVPGTLREGFARIHALDDPFARAMMTMFVIAEVHPFLDGNGRTARLVMNAELSAAGLSRIIVPTVYREDYLLPLKALSNHHDPTAYLRAMIRIQQWTAAFNYGLPRSALITTLKACNAFEENLQHYKLIFPEA
ncbi:MAG: Fic family protein [Rhodocyclaceae bacterium]|nr:Fic family protein [Rhodocyclaceae bacterium]